MSEPLSGSSSLPANTPATFSTSWKPSVQSFIPHRPVPLPNNDPVVAFPFVLDSRPVLPFRRDPPPHAGASAAFSFRPAEIMASRQSLPNTLEPGPSTGNSAPKRKFEMDSVDGFCLPKRAKVEVEAAEDVDVKPVVKAEAGAENFKVSALFNDPQADFVIVSKDGIRHRVESYDLLASRNEECYGTTTYKWHLSTSTYFKTLRKGGKLTSPLHLPLTISQTIEDVLSLVTRRPLGWIVNDGAFVTRTKRLVYLCDSWKSNHLLHRVSAMLSQHCIGNQDHNAAYVFYCAVLLNDMDLCRRALPLAAVQTWTEGDNTFNHCRGFRGAELGQSVVDVGAMTTWLFNAVPTTHRRALIRAFRLRGNDATGGLGDWEKVADEYFRLLSQLPKTGADDSQ